MAIFKEKIRNQYFRMPVEYVRNKGFTLKEIGLLALLCSLPETWKFSLEGLTRIVNEGIDSIRATYKKLDKKGLSMHRGYADRMASLHAATCLCT